MRRYISILLCALLLCGFGPAQYLSVVAKKKASTSGRDWSQVADCIIMHTFDSSSATQQDKSTSDIDGTVDNATFTSSGKFGGAYDYNGTSGRITLETGEIAAQANGASVLTIVVFVNVDVYPGLDTTDGLVDTIVSGGSAGPGLALRDDSNTDQVRCQARSQSSDGFKQVKYSYSTTGT